MHLVGFITRIYHDTRSSECNFFLPMFGEVSGWNVGHYTYYAEFSCDFPHPVGENCGIVPQITPLSFCS
jgi:hypothetical protein